MGEQGPIVSHGRGGQGNISADATPYADGSIVRVGEYGDQGDGAYSAGIGGAGNIGSAGIRQASAIPHDTDVVPEMARRSSSERRDGGAFHTGRGGQGNIHYDGGGSKESEDIVTREGISENDAMKKGEGYKKWADKLKEKLKGFARK
ncbi:hypothetical protein PHISCL_03295 [Aspergillus sclerotialis]|uniref:Uncharacterized protein n=1 Tax=Aspergillus sclerotialis TaxID=2070753 RepID=A0A3A2ZSI6_9EURO|nr:hypothetical protein PHISCL_03295 [Aspergillus sclerotialis]